MVAYKFVLTANKLTNTMLCLQDLLFTEQLVMYTSLYSYIIITKNS